MEISYKADQGITIIELSGRLDGTTAEEAQESINPHLEEASLIVFDMSTCEFVSSAGLRLLMVIGKSLAQKGGKGAMACLMAEIKEVMEMTGFDHVFPSFESLAEAMGHLKGKTS